MGEIQIFCPIKQSMSLILARGERGERGER